MQEVVKEVGEKMGRINGNLDEMKGILDILSAGDIMTRRPEATDLKLMRDQPIKKDKKIIIISRYG